MFGNFRCINSDNGKRLVCCVDTLGKANKLVVVNDCELELTTGRGKYIVDRRAFEPAWDGCGFVAVPLKGTKEQALYFDPCICVALVRNRMRWCDGSRTGELKPGTELPIPEELAAWEFIRKEKFCDIGSLRAVCEGLTWVNERGEIYRPDDVISFWEMELARYDRLAENKLWKLVMTSRPEDDELRETQGQQYLERRRAALMVSRYVHYRSLELYLRNHPEDAVQYRK